MSVMRGDATASVMRQLQQGEEVLLCFEAGVAEVNGRPDAAQDIESVLLVITGDRLLTFADSVVGEPGLDAAIPLGLVAGAEAEAGPFGTAVVVSLVNGTWVRFLIPSMSEAEARLCTAALGGPPAPVGVQREDAGSGVLEDPPRRDRATEEIPVVTASPGASREGTVASVPADPVAAAAASREAAEQSRSLAEQLAGLCSAASSPQLELGPALRIEADPSSSNTYFVAVHAERVPEGVCPRCRHENRRGAVFCDACGALV